MKKLISQIFIGILLFGSMTIFFYPFAVQAAVTAKIRLGAGADLCEITVFYADSSGKALPSSTKLVEGTKYQVKVKIPDEVNCNRTITKVELGDVVKDTGGGTSNHPFVDCAQDHYYLTGADVEVGFKIIYSNFTEGKTPGTHYALVQTSSGVEVKCDVKKNPLTGFAYATIGFGPPLDKTPGDKPPANAPTTPAHTPSNQNYYEYDLKNFDKPAGTLNNLLDVTSVPQFLVRLAKIVFILLGGVAAIVILVGAFRMVMSQGNAEGLTGAKRNITWAVIGLVVALLSYSIVAILQSFLGVN